VTTTALPPHTPIWKCGMAQSRQTSTDNMRQSRRPTAASAQCSIEHRQRSLRWRGAFIETLQYSALSDVFGDRSASRHSRLQCLT
jgi:hypothetical protein